MTDDTRGAIVDLTAIGVAAIAVYLIAANPPLRRTVWRALKFGIFTAAPRLLRDETLRAWSESAPRNAKVNLP